MNDRHFHLREVHVIWYRMPLKRAYGTARGVTTRSDNFLVLATAEGAQRTVRGVGECQPRHALTGDGGKDRVAAWTFLKAAADWLRGRAIDCSDPATAVHSVRQLMSDLQVLAVAHADDSNRDKPYRGTLLGIEVALLDIAARALDLQVSELLGKQRDEIGISISTISSSVDLTEVPARVVKQKRFPMTRVKGVGDLTYDLGLLETVARANRSVGREKPLWIDINEGLQFHQAADLLREIVDRMDKGILPASVAVEGMLPKASFTRLAELQQIADMATDAADSRGLDLRVMPDEGLWDVADLQQLIAAGGCRAINIKAPKAGGLLASLDLANAAVASSPGIHLCIGGMIGTSDITAWALHNLARALPRIDYLTAIPPTNVQERISDPLVRYISKESNIIAPQALPGLGAVARQDKVAPYVVASTVPSAEPAPQALVIEQVPDDTSPRTLSFAGDTSLGDVYVHRQGGELLERLEHNPMSFLEKLHPLLADSDAAVLNLETVLADSPSSPHEGRKPYLGWDLPERTVECLRQLGVMAVGLANNHTMDFGASHLLETRTYLEKAGISSFGAGANRKEAAAPLTLRLDFNGVERRVHIIAGMQIQAKLRDEYQFYAGPQQPGVNGLARSRLVKTIEQLRESDPSSLIMVFPHWGRNYQWADDRLRSMAEDFTNAGADLIIGHGAHMLQQCTFGQHTAAVYSLGNFLFNWGGRFDKFDAPPYGLVARVNLDHRDERWQVRLRLYPILIDNQRTGHRPAPVDEQGFQDVWTSLAKADLDGSFARHARAARDSLGYHIAFSFDTAGPDRQARAPQAATLTSDSLRGLNVYDDRESVAIINRLDRRITGSQLIARAAKGDGATVEWLASDTFMASLGERKLLFKGNRCLETASAARVVRSKALLKQLFTEAGVRHPVGRTAHSFEEALEIFEQLGPNVVVKPVEGDRGKAVTVGVTSVDDLQVAYERALAESGVLIEEFVEGPEFRCMIKQGECIAVIRRDAPNVIGDSVHTVRELIALKNDLRRRNPALHKRPIVVNEYLISYLERVDLTLDSVPDSGRKIYLGGAANLSVGGDSIDYTETVPAVIRETAIAAVGAVPGLNWSGVDIIYREPVNGGQPEAFVLEVNVNSDISGFHYPLVGSPRDVAGNLWRTRLAATTAPPDGRIAPLKRLPAPQPLPGAVAGGGPIRLDELVTARLQSQGAEVEVLAPRLRRVRQNSEVRLLHGASTTDDLAVTAQVINRRSMLSRVLRKAGVEVAEGSIVRSAEDVRRFATKVNSPLVLLPNRETGYTVLASVSGNATDSEIASAWEAAGAHSPVYARSCPPGRSLWVLATADEPLAAVVEGPADVTENDLARTSKAAVEAIRAIPELRWAAVRLSVASSGTGHGQVTVDSITQDPRYPADAQLVAGDLDRAVDAIISRTVGNSRNRRWWPLRRRRS